VEMSAVGVMHMPMLQFLCRGLAHTRHGTVESQRLACQRMIAIHRDLVVSHFHHGEQQIVVIICIFRTALELHADRDILRKELRASTSTRL